MADLAPAGCRISGGPWFLRPAGMVGQARPPVAVVGLPARGPGFRSAAPWWFFVRRRRIACFSGEVWLRHWASWELSGIAVQHPAATIVFLPIVRRWQCGHSAQHDDAGSCADRAGDPARFVIDRLTTAGNRRRRPRQSALPGIVRRLHRAGRSGERLAGLMPDSVTRDRWPASPSRHPRARNPVDLDVRSATFIGHSSASPEVA